MGRQITAAGAYWMDDWLKNLIAGNEMIYVVNTASLNLRKKPETGNNIISSLPEGQKIKLINEEPSGLWWKVTTQLNGHDLEGFVAARYLVRAEDYNQPPLVNRISKVHREENRAIVTRNTRESGWSFPLGEPNRPNRNTATDDTKRSALTRIVDWLEVEKSKRYQPTSTSTYCNIYAHDYCYLAGVYLPRVWWTPKSLVDLATGKSVAPIYGKTIQEMNANSLYTWLEEFGEKFGWRRSFYLEDLQQFANIGEVCIISGKNKAANKSGHVCAVVPETVSNKAHSHNSRFCPLQSQAGRHNHKYKTNYYWWNLSSFSRFGFWHHA